MSNSERSAFRKWAPIVFVSGLIGFEYYIFVTLFLPRMMSVLGWGLELIIFSSFTTMTFFLLFSWYQAIFTHPGLVAENINESVSNVDEIKSRAEKEIKRRQARAKKTPESQNSSQTNDEEKGLASEKEEPEDYWTAIQRDSYCFRCNKIKPSRAHHCKICNICILRMDHHCPWVANCVGQGNHRYFIQFLVYCVTAISFMLLNYVFVYFLSYSERSKLVSENEDLVLLVAFVLGIGLDVAIGSLLYSQASMTSENLTTVETHSKELQKRNPFKKGSWAENMKDVFGHDPKYWFLPIEPRTQNRRPLQL